VLPESGHIGEHLKVREVGRQLAQRVWAEPPIGRDVQRYRPADVQAFIDTQFAAREQEAAAHAR
jgi:hypothetical protein